MASGWWHPLTQFHRTPVFGKIWLVVAGFGLYAAAWAAIDHHIDFKSMQMQTNYYALLGLVLGMLLVFRTNTAYDRWWEGRKLWGQLVNDSRNLAVKIQACVQIDELQKREVGRWLAAFAEALRDHLRGAADVGKLAAFAGETDRPPHVPAWIVRRLYQRIEAWRQADCVGGFELLFLDRHAAALLDICGACERIKNTPPPGSYFWFVRQAIGLYLLTLPIGIVADFGYWTILATMITGYFMVGVETIAEQIEEPFGTDRDDLRLDDLCQTIRQSVDGIFAEQATPEQSPSGN